MYTYNSPNYNPSWDTQSNYFSSESDSDLGLANMDLGPDDDDIEHSSTSSEQDSLDTSTSGETHMVMGTPPKVKELIHALEDGELDPDCDLTRNDDKLLKSSVQQIAEITASPERRSQATKTKRACLRKLFPKTSENESSDEIPSPSRQRIAYDRMSNSSWIGGLLGDLNKLCSSQDDNPDHSLVNFHHISSPDRNGEKVRGFHLSLPGKHDNIQYADVVINHLTEVWSGHFRYPNSADTKYSTFFPRYITTELKFQQMLSSSRKVATFGNRVLLEMKPQVPGKANFFAEAYTMNHGTCIHSTYPLMTFEDWIPGHSFKLGFGQELTSESILFMLKELLSQHKNEWDVHNPLRYIDRRTAILDIAPKVSKDIFQGIYFRFPLSEIKSMDGFSESETALQND